MKRMGIEDYHCSVCDGKGYFWLFSKDEANYENWQEFEPPSGPGWQLWETVSEGSPISQVFASAGEMKGWLINEEGYSETAVTKFMEVGWVPSLTMSVSGEGETIIKSDIDTLSEVGR